MEKQTKQYLAELMNSLPFVKWDRYFQNDFQYDGGLSIGVFGWIDREDGRSDYVLIGYNLKSNLASFSTSSAKYSKTINRIIFGKDSPHDNCKRVEIGFKNFGVINVIKLKK